MDHGDMNTPASNGPPAFGRREKARRVMLAAALSLAAFVPARLRETGGSDPCAQAALEASQIMSSALAAVARRAASGHSAPAEAIDPNRTGLIGREADELMTSLGSLEAKRTTTNPNFAGLLVYLLCRAGVAPGSRIAIGSSGSFPALLLASLSAARALKAEPVAIISLGASSYGATGAGFNLLHLYELVRREGVFSAPPAAVTLGGEKDTGLGLDPELKDRLLRQISESGIPFIHEPDLRANVRTRMRIYGDVAAFINIGGAWANLGTDSRVLELEPGLNRRMPLPPENRRGVIAEMAARGVPVIHLLHIKGLVTKYGMPWDPVPLPQAGQWTPPARPGLLFHGIAAAYFVLLALIAAPRRNAARTHQSP